MAHIIKITFFVCCCTLLVAGISIKNALSIDIIPTYGFSVIKSDIVEIDNKNHLYQIQFLFDSESLSNSKYLAIHINDEAPQMCSDQRHKDIKLENTDENTKNFTLKNTDALAHAFDTYGCIVIKNV